MKFLYIAAEHVSGTLSLFKREHERRGDECRFVTFWHSRWDFEDDICLDLPLMPDRSWVLSLRGISGVNPFHARPPDPDNPPVWRPRNFSGAAFRLRDHLLWPQIEDAIRRYHLDEFDLVQLDGGLDFTRDARFVREVLPPEVPVVCFYHGTDLRGRGIIPAVDARANLRLTCEWDLLDYDSRLEYLHLPFDLSRWPRRDYRMSKSVRICHAARNPLKGTSYIVNAIERLKSEFEVELILIRDLPYEEALRVKSGCDIYVDQLTNEGGWGYGMSTIEACAMTLPVVTNIPPQMETRIAPHPFVQADADSIYGTLKSLLKSPSLAKEHALHGREWVERTHSTGSVVDALYEKYESREWLKNR